MKNVDLDKLFKDGQIFSASNEVLDNALEQISFITSIDNHWITRALIINSIKNQRHIDKLERRNEIYTRIIIALTAVSIILSIASFFSQKKEITKIYYWKSQSY